MLRHPVSELPLLLGNIQSRTFFFNPTVESSKAKVSKKPSQPPRPPTLPRGSSGRFSLTAAGQTDLAFDGL